MTIATTAKNREQELAELLKTHRQELEDMEALASKVAAYADECDRQADALATDLERPLKEVSGEIEQHRAEAARKRQSAADLRRRAVAYAEKHQVQALTAELEGLRAARAQAERRRALIARRDELEAEAAQLEQKHLEAALLLRSRRVQEIAAELEKMGTVNGMPELSRNALHILRMPTRISDEALAAQRH